MKRNLSPVIEKATAQGRIAKINYLLESRAKHV